jgi:hypothetical protein
LADTNCCFTLVDVGAYGRENNSSGKAFGSGDLNVPPMRNIAGTGISVPLYCVGDEAFRLKPNLIRPFLRRELDFAKTIFNGKLYSTRQTIECVFGLLTKKFGGFQKAFETNVEVTDRKTKSACVVYGCIRETQTIEIERREEEILEQEQQNVAVSAEHAACFGRPSTEALQVRETLRDYFVSVL